MRRCFYYTDLGQNAVFHNFAIQIALIQHSGRSKHAPIRRAGSHFLTSAKVDSVKLRLIELYALT